MVLNILLTCIYWLQAELQKECDELKATDQDTPEELEKLFIDHFGEDGHGRMRCAARGVTKTMVYGRKLASQTTSTESIATIRVEFEEKFELQKKETEARIQAERDACKAEMELQLQAFKQEMLSQLQSQLQSKTGEKQLISLICGMPCYHVNLEVVDLSHRFGFCVVKLIWRRVLLTTHWSKYDSHTWNLACFVTFTTLVQYIQGCHVIVSISKISY